MYLASTAVVAGEFVKLITCFAAIAGEKRGFRGLWQTLYVEILSDPWDCFLVSIPSLTYVLQNNLLYLAVSNLDAATFQVTYQLKILTTALFFRFMLKREISSRQWLALVILFLGVASVQLGAVSPKPKLTSNSSVAERIQHPHLGFIAIIIASVLSGFAGVFFEKLLKTSTKSLWVRNVQLAGFGIPIGLVTVLLQDGSKVKENGFFYGYDGVVMTVVLLQSFGGLLVAAVVKYADNILKGFATSVAIIVSALLAIYLFSFHPTGYFVVGTVLVCTATVLYARYPPGQATVKLLPK